MHDETLASQIFQAISPAPCGEDPTYNDLFATILEERDKGRGPMPGEPDWKKVEENGLNILSSVGKHLPTLSSLVIALAFNRGVQGLCDGLEASTRFLQEYWEDMFPPIKRKKGRIKAVYWLNERIGEMEKNGKLEFDTVAILDQTLGAIEKLRVELAAKFEGSDPPSFLDLKEALEMRRVDIEAKEKKAQAEAEAKEAAAQAKEAAEAAAKQASEQASQPTSAPPASTEQSQSPPPRQSAPTAAASQTIPTKAIQNLKEIDIGGEDLGSQLKALITIAANVRALLPSRSIAYRLLRISLWTQAKLPNIREGKETYIPAPNEAIPQSLNNQANNAAWGDLLNRCEELFQRYPLWLDLQFFAAKAARSLGGEYTLAAEVIESESVSFIDRFPGLRDLCFDDGRPFVSNDCRVWLDSMQQGEESLDSGAAGEAEAELREFLQGDGKQKYAEALAKAQQLIAESSSPLNGLRLKLQVVDFLLDSQQGLWALQLLKAMIEETDNYNLGHWEPRLAGRVWSRTLRACRGLENDEEATTLARKAMQRLANLDISQLGGHKL